MCVTETYFRRSSFLQEGVTNEQYSLLILGQDFIHLLCNYLYKIIKVKFWFISDNWRKGSKIPACHCWGKDLNSCLYESCLYDMDKVHGHSIYPLGRVFFSVWTQMLDNSLQQADRKMVMSKEWVGPRWADSSSWRPTYIPRVREAVWSRLWLVENYLHFDWGWLH